MAKHISSVQTDLNPHYIKCDIHLNITLKLLAETFKIAASLLISDWHLLAPHQKQEIKIYVWGEEVVTW